MSAWSELSGLAGRHGLPAGRGLLARLLITIVAIGVLASSTPAEPWAWAVLAVGFGAFVLGTFLMTSRALLSLGLLAYAALSASVITGMPGSNALVLMLVGITDIAVMTFPRTPRLRRNLPLLAVGIGCVAGLVASAAWFGRSESWFFSQLLWMAVLVLFGLNRRYDEVRAQQTAELLEQTRLAQREHARAAALDERTRIARELHDVLAHSLGALSVQLEVAEALLAERGDTAGALERVRRSRRLAVQGLTEARNAVATLRQDDVPALPEALAALTEQHRKDHGAEARFGVIGVARPLDPGVVVALLGTAREALTNAARHAPGQPVEVGLEYRHAVVRLGVRNALAAGRKPSEPVGYGLAGMRERLALVGGTLTAGAKGGDWVVLAEVGYE
ncbi:histidine kinase [Kribbella flavida DSM 17836]|uniref:histidine kinase n=1 Tax=Kribbella flavida (strain DSM 17836 / JCM 10339 / NBRC 14399) TaxID=479435 RepID=D2PUX4_KRIFD|nr:histidine kinase [Kribbella flavida]ADB31440.1 histidine kinase [Kribbella flavida DSM 17836]